jgi:hypothetical protein
VHNSRQIRMFTLRRRVNSYAIPSIHGVSPRTALSAPDAPYPSIGARRRALVDARRLITLA